MQQNCLIYVIIHFSSQLESATARSTPIRYRNIAKSRQQIIFRSYLLAQRNKEEVTHPNVEHHACAVWGSAFLATGVLNSGGNFSVKGINREYKALVRNGRV